MLLNACQNHPESKSLGPDGKPCEFDKRGLLQRAQIVANWPPIYIGKESDRHWEEGEDLSLLDFKAAVYRRKGYVVSTDEQLIRIAQVNKRELRRRGINQHTLEKVCKKEPVRAIHLDNCLRNSKNWNWSKKASGIEVIRIIESFVFTGRAVSADEAMHLLVLTVPKHTGNRCHSKTVLV